MLKHGKTPVTTVFVHCSATRPEWLAGSPLSEKIKEFTRWHRAKGWGTIGYHHVIDRDGTVGKGRDESLPGAHVAGHNTGSIGICLVGGHGSNENDDFLDHYMPAQEAALRALIEDIKTRAAITKVRGHNEVAAKACPGFSVKRWFAKKPPRPALTESTTMQAGAVQILSGAGAGVTAIGALEGYAQLAIIGLAVIVMLAAAWIMRERLRKWAREVAS
jgi:hypothetical protein